jgi:catechol 2,3-dioxygenase-like lactoylglutathione lyase family enzyme
MSEEVQFISTTPILASLDIKRSLDFYCSKLGFCRVFEEVGAYGIASCGSIQIHFWACSEKHIAENTSCRIRVCGIEKLFAQCSKLNIVHPNAPLDVKPWGTSEFAILDPDGNLVTFAEWREE